MNVKWKTLRFISNYLYFLTAKIADASPATLHILCIQVQDKDRAAG